jgi:hypothetical protein
MHYAQGKKRRFFFHLLASEPYQFFFIACFSFIF